MPATCTVTLLIGTDAPDTHAPLDSKLGSYNEPYAVLTALGWAVRGPCHTNKSHTNKAAVRFARADISQQLHKMWATDFTEAAEDIAAHSPEDELALAIMDKSIKRVYCGSYQLALPWRDAEPKLPSSRYMAEKRLG